jgi:hypothetical protein
MGQEVETKEKEDLVTGFNWDDDDSFFPAPVVESKEEKQRKVVQAIKDAEEPEVEELEADKKKPKKAKEAEDDELEDEPEFFESEKTKDSKGEITKNAKGKSEEVENEAGEEPEKDTFFTTLASELKEKGIFSAIQLDENEEIDEERFFELQEEELNARVDETFEGFFEEVNNDPDAVAFIKFKKQGGSTAEFFSVFREASSLPDDLDLVDVKNQEKILKHYYLNVEKIDEEDLEDKLEWVKDKGKTEAYAKKYYKEINDKERVAKLTLIDKQEKAEKSAKENSDKLRGQLQAVLAKGEGEGLFKFDAEDIKESVSYITKPTVKIGANKFITAFQADLSEIMKDQKKMLTLAKIVRKKFDIPDLKKIVTTEVSKGVKAKLQEAKQNKTSRSTTSTEKSLADYFPG